MPCFHPLAAWKARLPAESARDSSGEFPITPRGKRGVSFQVASSYKDRPIDLPCGRCVGCLQDRANSWSTRCEHEASLHADNWFVTLTYSDEHLPPGGNLRPADLQNFWKRLRKAHGRGPRYFACGEYGERTDRPHYHALIFNLPLGDARPSPGLRPGTHPSFNSESLSALWPWGLVYIGTFSPESAQYVANYVGKRLGAPQLRGRVPEFQVMSRRPGLGRQWLLTHHKTDVQGGMVVSRGGHQVKAPRYYLGLLESEDPFTLRKHRRARKAHVPPTTSETLRRNHAREDFRTHKQRFFAQTRSVKPTSR